MVLNSYTANCQRNDQTAPNNYPNSSNPTKLMPLPGDTLTGNGNHIQPGVDQGTYINGNADSIRSSSTTKKNKNKNTTSK